MRTRTETNRKRTYYGLNILSTYETNLQRLSRAQRLLSQHQVKEDGLDMSYESSVSSDHEDVNPMPTKKKIKNHIFFSSSDKGESEGHEGHEGHVGGVDAGSNDGKDEC